MQELFTVRDIHISMEIWGAILGLIMAFCMYLSTNFPRQKRRDLIILFISIAILLSMDAFAWIYRGNTSLAGYWMVRISNFLVFFMSDEILLVYHRYLCSYFSKEEYEKIRVRVLLVYGICALMMLLVCISPFINLFYYFDAQNYYHRSALHPLVLIMPLIGMILDGSILIQYRKTFRKEVFWSMLSYLVLPVIGSILLLFYYGISLVNISICISSVFMFFVAIMEQNHIVEEKEKEAYDLRATIMLSQIRPHFIYNTLTTIKYLCKKDPKEAMQTIDEFSRYLRGNLDSLMAKRPIYFSKELEHVKNYLSIEQRRFGNRVNVEYEVGEEDFLVPSLILQPIVENAVKHGITKREQGGTVWIRTEKKDEDYYMIVTDDGVGFDPKQREDDERTHAGIENTRSRLKSMCGGDLYITSIPGKGTKVIMKIPAGGVRR